MLNLISWFSFHPTILSKCKTKRITQFVSTSMNGLVHIVNSYSQVPSWGPFGSSVSRLQNRIMRYSESQKC